MINTEEDVSWMIAAAIPQDVNRTDVTVTVESKEQTDQLPKQKQLAEQSERDDDDCDDDDDGRIEKVNGGTEVEVDPSNRILDDGGYSPTQLLPEPSNHQSNRSTKNSISTNAESSSANEKARIITLKRLEGGEYCRVVFDHKRNNLPKFHLNEIARGRRLGKGSFSNVDEIRGILVHYPPAIKTNPLRTALSGTKSSITTVNAACTSTTTTATPTTAIDPAPRRIPRPARSKIRRNDTVAIDDIESRQFIEMHCFRNSGEARYAIKMARRDVLVRENAATNHKKSSNNNNMEDIAPSRKSFANCHECDVHHHHRHHCSQWNDDDCKVPSPDDEEECQKIMCICDLAIETAFLSSLQHPNIIKLRAVANVDPFSDQYFLIMDRLGDTLQHRIEGTWRARERRLYSLWGRIFWDRTGKRRLAFFEHRLELAFDIASAIGYLHEKKIIHRDIKPGNIGFDIRDDIKLFDFGMARELRPELKEADDNYRFSKCGSPSYMAPEVWEGLPYNSSADVYSFGVVLYEMLSLRRAFDFCTANNTQDFAHEVFGKDQRPTLTRLRAPTSIKDLLPFCWNNNPEYRFDIGTVDQILRQELILLRNGNESTLRNYARRRSTFIFSTKGGSRRNPSSGSLEESVHFILSPYSNSGGHSSIASGGKPKVNFVTDVASFSSSFQSKGSSRKGDAKQRV